MEPQKLLESTRGRIIRLLRRQSRSVAELARELQVTDTAVRVHLAGLERDGLVRQTETRPGVRKPTGYYGLTDAAEALFPRPYAALLTELLGELEGELPEDRLDAVLERVGRRLGAGLGLPSSATFPERLDRLEEVVASLGGLAEVQEEDGDPVLQGFSCPVRDVACRDGRVCRVLAAMLEEALDRPVLVECRLQPTPCCRFRIKPTIP